LISGEYTKEKSFGRSLTSGDMISVLLKGVSAAGGSPWISMKSLFLKITLRMEYDNR